MAKRPTKKPKKKLKRPELTRLGTLTELTQGMGGPLVDGGSGMSRA